jgi:cell wall-associated NlpC family hydrolase
LWGGTSAKGMDCSGFTKMVYFLNGIVLERDASQQVNQGSLIDTQNGFDKLQTGDLLFFGEHKTDSTKERVTHVAIYLGNYQYIHEAGRVKINSFDKDASNFNEYRLKHFIRAKRILNSIDKNGISSIKRNKFYLGEM